MSATAARTTSGSLATIRVDGASEPRVRRRPPALPTHEYTHAYADSLDSLGSRSPLPLSPPALAPPPLSTPPLSPPSLSPPPQCPASPRVSTSRRLAPARRSAVATRRDTTSWCRPSCTAGRAAARQRPNRRSLARSTTRWHSMRNAERCGRVCAVGACGARGACRQPAARLHQSGQHPTVRVTLSLLPSPLSASPWALNPTLPPRAGASRAAEPRGAAQEGAAEPRFLPGQAQPAHPVRVLVRHPAGL
eukprot:4814320-Prymnesium_polylepis.1